MRNKSLVCFTKYVLDFMFFSGIAVCIGVPFIFNKVGEHFSIFKRNYISFSVIFMIAGIFALLILWELRKMFQTVLKENSFVMDNVRSLKRMGIYAFAIAIVMMVRLFLVITPAALVIVGVFIIAGLFSLVLSQVFDQAVTYKEENDLTI